jgi:predicted dehydrogenase
MHGRSLLSRALKRSGLHVVAVCDVDRTRREAARSSVDEHYAKESPGYSGTRGFTDHREMLEVEGLDAVIIATPDHWHAPQVIDAARAGKHVYVEKPLSHTLREGRVMVEAVRASGVVCQVGSQQRTEYSGRFIRAVELVRNGRVGRVVSVQVGLPTSRVGPSAVACDLPGEEPEPGLDWDRWLGPAPWRAYSSVLSPRGVHDHYPEWRLYREYSGGMVTDWGAHNLDIAQWALGRDASGPVRVEPPRAADADHGARLVYDDGVEVVHGGANGVMFTGEKAWLFVSREKIMASRDEVLKDPEEGESFRLPRPADHLTDWLEAIERGGRPSADVEVGARTAACCHLLNLAYWHGRVLRWDPIAWRFVGEHRDDELMDVPRRAGYELPAF